MAAEYGLLTSPQLNVQLKCSVQYRILCRLCDVGLLLAEKFEVVG